MSKKLKFVVQIWLGKENMDPWWKTWREVLYLSQGKDIYLYGRSEDWLPKTLNKLDGRLPKAIIDRNPLYEDTSYDDSCDPTDILLELKRREVFFIITAGVFEGIVKILDDRGFLQVLILRAVGISRFSYLGRHAELSENCLCIIIRF